MSDLKHTPGLWMEGVYEWCVVTDDDTPVAQAETGNPNWRENAKLIAAAPDLLAACEEMLGIYPLSGYELEAFCDVTLIPLMRAAVAKAKGS